jgi:DNA-binding MarR family transcriptional regulator
MLRHAERDLEILTTVGEGVPLTQRALAERLGVALGLANLYLKRLVTKGYIKVTEFPAKPYARKRLKYVLTPHGIAEKARLTYEYVGYSLRLYRRTRENLRDAMAVLTGTGIKRFALYGIGEAAELAYLTLREFGLEPVGVYAREAGADFLGLPVRSLGDLRPDAVDAVVVATFDRPEDCVSELSALGIASDRILTMRRLTIPVTTMEET